MTKIQKTGHIKAKEANEADAAKWRELETAAKDLAKAALRAKAVFAALGVELEIVADADHAAILRATSRRK